MQIHQLDNFNGELNSNAYFAVDNGADTGKVSAQELLADVNEEIEALDSSLNGRIDNIIAGGAAPSEAEIIDARHGNDGVNYTSLGAAIRTQFENLENDTTKKFEIENIGGSPILYDTVFNEYVSNTTGAFTPYNNWARSDYIPVNEGDVIYYYVGTATNYTVFYDENHSFISNRILYDGLSPGGNYRSFVVPAGAKYYAFSNSESAFLATKLWKKSGLIDDTEVSSLKTYSSQKIFELAYGSPEIVLPKECYAVVGSEFNIYYENIIICQNIDDFYIYPFINPYNTVTYNTYSDRLQIMPTADMIGDYTLTINIKSKHDWSNNITRLQIPLHIIDKTALSSKKVIFIGDSLTNAGYYPYEIQEVLSEGGVESLGTQVSHPWIGGVQKTINHEGRGGWSANDYVTSASIAGVDNEFWNPNTSKFDFTYYMSRQGYSRPDIVFLNLGTNGTPDSTISAISEMITSIHAYDPTIPICVSLITPPATQDGWTYTAPGGSAGQFAIQQMSLNKRYIAEYDDVISNVYVSPVYFNLDRYHDYNTAQFPVSARNPEIVTRQINNVHPSIYGYYKFADVYWAMIQALLS